MKNFIVLVICILNFAFVQAQDVHFSQYNSSPTSLNPAQTGFMDGNLRVAANYRNQWFSNSSFATYALALDANIARRSLDYDMLGVGLSFYQDIEERNGYSNTNISLSVAYNVMITKKPLQYIGFGVQPSLISKQINLMDAVYGTLYKSGFNVDPLGFSEYGSFKLDLNSGISYYGYYNQRHSFAIGATVSHITQPNFGISGDDFLYRKYTGYVLTELEVSATGNAWLKPSLYFTKQGPSLELLPMLMGRFQFDNAINDVFLSVGAGFRMVGHNENNLFSSDFIGVIQAIIKSYTIGFSYDVTVSGAKEATSRNGGPELNFIMDLNFEKRRSHPRYFKVFKP